MTIESINIRDPYILMHKEKYYMYGTRAKTCWRKADGFDCYISNDLNEWEGPHEIFCKPEGFWADRNYWAPECIFYQEQFFLISTFGTAERKGIQVLVSDDPTGPFTPLTEDVITPKDWSCIDGTVYFEGSRPYLIFSHSFEDNPDGEMCVAGLSSDLMKIDTEIRTLFTAKEAKWAKPVPFAEAEFGLKGDVFFTDGPTVYRQADQRLIMLWSSWGDNGYAVGMAISESGKIEGPWTHQDKAVFEENGGHGMLLKTKEGDLKYILHYPNEKNKEHPLLLDVIKKEGQITLKIDKRREGERG